MADFVNTAVNDGLTKELNDVVNEINVYELASKTTDRRAMTSEESEVSALLDARFKEIGKKGCDPYCEIAAFISKILNEEVFNAPDELLDRIFDRDSIGEFDDYMASSTPKNTFVAYEAAKGGNVERSYLDITSLRPVWKNYQIETDISYADVRRNGWKTVARIIDYAGATFTNKTFADVFTEIDTIIVNGAANYITETTAKPTQTSMDKLALYLNDRDGGVIVGLSKYIQAASKLTGFVSADLINEVHRNGYLGMYDGNPMIPISSAKKLGDGSLMLPDGAVYGIAGKIGTLTTRGDVNVYQDMNNNKEQIHLLFKDYNVGYAISPTMAENIAKIAMTQ